MNIDRRGHGPQRRDMTHAAAGRFARRLHHVHLHERRRGGLGFVLQLQGQVGDALLEQLVLGGELNVALLQSIDLLMSTIDLWPQGTQFQVQMMGVIAIELRLFLESLVRFKLVAFHGSWTLPSSGKMRAGENRRDGKQLQEMGGTIHGDKNFTGERSIERPGYIIHEVGGAITGADAKKSVCNGWNQTWDVKNLFLCDGAPFASNADKNPTLTIMALAWRTCDRIVEEARKGNL